MLHRIFIVQLKLFFAHCCGSLSNCMGTARTCIALLLVYTYNKLCNFPIQSRSNSLNVWITADVLPERIYTQVPKVME
jgi:hypothetical protein